MTTTQNLAKFTINSTPSEDSNGKRGYDAIADEVLTCQLEAQPAAGVLSYALEVYDPNDETSPLASKDAALQVWDTNSLPKVTSTDTAGSEDLTVDSATEFDCFTIRCTAVVQGGAHVYERMVAVKKVGLRTVIPAEQQQYTLRGWADAMHEWAEYLAGGGPALSPPSPTDDDKVAIALSEDLSYDFITDDNIASGADIDVGKLDYTSASNGDVLVIVGGVPTWSTSPLGPGPADPGDDDKIVFATGGLIDYADGVKITNSGSTQDGLAFGTATIRGVSSDLEYDVASGQAHIWKVNATGILQVNSAGLRFSNSIGDATIEMAEHASGDGDPLKIIGQDAFQTSGDWDGGDVWVYAGAKRAAGSGVNGAVIIGTGGGSGSEIARFDDQASPRLLFPNGFRLEATIQAGGSEASLLYFNPADYLEIGSDTLVKKVAFRVASGQNYDWYIGGSGTLTLNDTSLSFSNTVANPTITQGNTTAATGQPLSIKAQTTTGATGGALKLHGGEGNTTHGFVEIYYGPTLQARFDQVGLDFTGGNITTGEVRLSNNIGLYFENQVGGTAVTGMKLTGADILDIGDANAAAVILKAASTGYVALWAGATPVVTFDQVGGTPSAPRQTFRYTNTYDPIITVAASGANAGVDLIIMGGESNYGQTLGNLVLRPGHDDTTTFPNGEVQVELRQAGTWTLLAKFTQPDANDWGLFLQDKASVNTVIRQLATGSSDAEDFVIAGADATSTYKGGRLILQGGDSGTGQFGRDVIVNTGNGASGVGQFRIKANDVEKVVFYLNDGYIAVEDLTGTAATPGTTRFHIYGDSGEPRCKVASTATAYTMALILQEQAADETVGSIGAHSSTTFTKTVTGAVVGDHVLIGSANMEAGLIATGWVSAADTVTVKLTNTTTSALDPADTNDYDITVIRLAA